MSVPGGDHAIWIVAAVLYVLDAARLLAPRGFLLVEGARGRLAPALADAPFTLAGRIVAWGGPRPAAPAPGERGRGGRA